MRLDTLPSVRSATHLGGLSKREYMDTVIGEITSRSLSTKNSAFRPNPMLPPVTEPRSAKQIDFLSERRKEREQAFKNYLTTSDAKNKPKDIDNEIKYKILVLDENKTLR